MIPKTALANISKQLPSRNSNGNNLFQFATNTTPIDIGFKSQKSSIPIATQLTLDVAGDVGRGLIANTYLIKFNGQKGSGFLLKSGIIVTNLHVVCDKDGKFDPSYLSQVTAVSATNDTINFSSYRAINGLDLLLLWPTQNVVGGLEIDTISNVKVGESVYTWGHPLGYNGPNPLFSAGYLSGIAVNNEIKHLVTRIRDKQRM